MSAVATCTRVTIPRVTLQFSQCRLMSTEAVSVSTAARPLPIPVPAKTTATKYNLSERMHRSLYPKLYERGKLNKSQTKVYVPPRKKKKINEKWKPLMAEDGVNKGLSKTFGVPIFHPSTLNIRKACPSPVAAVSASQISLLDPTGVRTRLFSRDNPECARVGDVLLVRQRNGDPFAGVCINIRRRGVDTTILLRGQLTRVGVEMWYKIYSPLVEAIEVVQRAAKRARRARLTYMRTFKHDRGSVENVVRMYMRQKAALGTAEDLRKSGAAKAAAMSGKKPKGRGKKR